MTTPTPKWPYPGARWWKVDLHAHTPASKDWQPSKQVTPDQWLLRYMEAGVDCVVIADHNSGEWIDKLKGAYEQLKAKQAAGFRELYLFPGVELSVNGGFHLLAILDLNKTTCDISQLLGKVDYNGTNGASDGVTRKSAVEVIEAIASAGGLPIPAHADQSKGLLQCDGSGGACAALDANTLRQVFECGRLLAMEVIDRNAPKPEIYKEAKCEWTEVLGSDCHSFDASPLPGSRFTWVKMGRPSLEGLRLASLDGPKFSIRRSDDTEPFDPFQLPEHIIESVEISNARYMGRGQPEKLRFHPWFNALVGGRGTGKSTVVHALRLAFRRKGDLEALPEKSEARSAFERFIKEPQSRNDEDGALDYRSSRKTEIKVTMTREGDQYLLRWQQDGSGTAVEERVNGTWKQSGSQSITSERFPVRMFSQGQITALAGESQEALLTVIDEAAPTQPAQAALEEAQRRFLALRAQIRELDAKLKGRDDVRVNLDDAKRKLAGFEGKQHAEILKGYQLRSRQSREISRQVSNAEQLAARLKTEAEEISAEDVPQGLFSSENVPDQQALVSIERIRSAVKEAASAIRAAAEQLADAVKRERTGLAAGAWRKAFDDASTAYTKLTEDLRTEGVADPSEYGKLVQERQRLEGEIARLDSLQKEREKVVAETTAQGVRVRESRREISRARNNFLANTLAQNPYVRIELLPYGRDARAIERSLREVLGVADDRFDDDILQFENDMPKKGVVADLLNNLPQDPQSAALTIERKLDTLASRFERACAGKGDFGGHFNNYLQRELSKRPEILDRLLVWSPEDGLKVEYSRKGDGTDFQPIGQASAGQRAAAMLAFLLAHGDEPLVLDQPESDLDNHLIYDLVVRQIRDNKLRRQMIVVTHNPNIVVNGDAEMLHAMDFKGGQCRVVQAGSLQDHAMREEVCRVMEGGREAFERRYRRLGRES